MSVAPYEIVHEICKRSESDGIDTFTDTRGLHVLVYLVDWKAANQFGEEATPIVWRHHYFGVYSYEIEWDLTEGNLFDIEYEHGFSRGDSVSIDVPEVAADDSVYVTPIPSEINTIIDEVLEEVSGMTWGDLLEHIYNNTPLGTTAYGETIELVAGAQKRADDLATKAVEEDAEAESSPWYVKIFQAIIGK